MKLNRFIAFDNSSIEIVSKKINDNGYLVLKCIFARTGIQERYGAEINADFEASKLYKEYRSPEEVFKPEVLQAFQNVVITNDHPTELLNPHNTKFHAMGFVSSKVEIIDNTYLQSEITIYDHETIEDIESGKKELSAGYLYSLEIVENPNYDYVQTDIKPNHIAIVQAGRCGSSCSMAFDNIPNQNKGENMKVIFKRMLPDGTEEVISEVEVENEDLAKNLQGVANALFEATKIVSASDEGEMKAKDEEIQTLKDEAKAKDEELDKLQADLDTKEPKEVATDSKIVIALAHDMAKVIAVANDAGIDTGSKGISCIKKAVIAKYQPDLALDGKSEEYLGYAFDNVATQLKGADSSYLKGLHTKPTKALDEAQKQTDEAHASFDSKFGGTK